MKKIIFTIISLILFVGITNAKSCNVISGTGKNIGDEIACGTEHFYVMSNDGEQVKLLSKYNLMAGVDYIKIDLDNIEGSSISVVFTDSKVQEAIKNGYYNLYTTNCTSENSVYTCSQVILTRSSNYASKIVFFDEPISSLHDAFKDDKVQEIFDSGYKYKATYSYNKLIYGISFINENTDIYDYKTIVFDTNSRITYTDVYEKEEVKKLLDSGYVFSEMYGETYYTCGSNSECSNTIYGVLLYKDYRYDYANFFADVPYSNGTSVDDYLTNNNDEYNKLLNDGYTFNNYIYTKHTESGSNVVNKYYVGISLKKQTQELDLYNVRQDELAIGAHGDKIGEPAPEEIGVIGSASIWGYWITGEVYDEGYVDAYFTGAAGDYLDSYYNTLANDGFDIIDVNVPTVDDINKIAYNITQEYLPLSDWWYEWEEAYSDMLNTPYYIVGSLKNYIPEEYSWLWSTTYWTGTWDPNDEYAYFVDTLGNLCSAHYCEYVVGAGLRPVVTINNDDIIYNIETKTDGNGTVTPSAETEHSGNEVTFVVTPNEGFELKEVKVTDSNGNIITFTDYKFTMPDANVIIEATFVPKNPETTTINIIIGIILSIISIVIVLKFKKKANWLNT